MEVCPLCNIEVQELKSNSHILPRWMMSEIKTNGKVISVKILGDISKQQTDAKADIVCSKCEEKFTECDTFSAQFFRDRMGELPSEVLRQGDQSMKCLIFNENLKENLWRFVVSIFIRGHLYEVKVKNKDILGNCYGQICELFNQKKADYYNFPLMVFYYNAAEEIHTMPFRTKWDDHDCLDVILFGYRFTLFVDERRAPTGTVTMQNIKNIFIPIIEGTKNKLFEDLMDTMSKNPSPFKK